MFLIYLFTLLAFSEPHKIVVLDTLYERKDQDDFCQPPIDMRTKKESNNHAANVIDTIRHFTKTKNHCFINIGFWPSEKDTDINTSLELIRNMKPTIVVFAMESIRFNVTEFLLFKEISKTSIVIAAAGNSGIDLSKRCVVYIACYYIPGVHIVGALIKPNKQHLRSNRGQAVTHWAQGVNVRVRNQSLTGTSIAAAVHTAKVIDGL